MDHEPAFSIVVDDGGDAVTVHVTGACDAASEVEFAACLEGLLAGKATTITLDLSRCTLLCARCVGLMLHASSSLDEPRRIVVVNASPLVRKVLRITEADQVLAVASA